MMKTLKSDRKMNLKNKILLISIFLTTLFLNTGCSRKEPGITAEPAKTVNESQVLYDYLKKKGDYINSEAAPAIMTAAELYTMLNRNIHLIDLREADQFNEGHIEGAVNVRPENVIDYFENRIDAPYFERVVFLCNRGQLSAYVNGIMRILGCSNTYSVRFGMSGWNTRFAITGWDQATATFPGNLTMETLNQPAIKGGMPEIATGGMNGFQIARLRAKALLDTTQATFLINYSDIEKAPEKYDVVAYVPADWFGNNMHPAGALNFIPKASLSTEADLKFLSPGKPVAVYCFNGHHSAHAVAWLRMMGYEAYSVIYGANGFMYDLFGKNDKNTPRQWTDLQKNDFPFKSGNAGGGIKEEKKVVVKQTQGGCA